MTNKETLQSYNNRLSDNNLSLEDIIERINNLPVAGGTTTPDSTEYIQDGLIAWFDGEDDLDENGHWNSRIGDDYFYQSYPSGGTQMKDLKTSNAIVNNTTFCAKNTADYLLQDYTIEVVGGMVPGEGNALLTFNKTKTVFIAVGQQKPGELSLQNTSDAVNYYEKVYGGLLNKRFSCAINLLAVAPRGTAAYAPRLLYSVNGSPWYFWGFTPNSKYSGGISVSSASGYKSLTCTLLSYYEAQYPNAGEVNCIRVYNRRLTDQELAHNYKIDKERFNLDNLEG